MVSGSMHVHHRPGAVAAQPDQPVLASKASVAHSFRPYHDVVTSGSLPTGPGPW